MNRSYRIRRKKDGLFWKLEYSSLKGHRVATFVEEGDRFPSVGAARNSFIQKSNGLSRFTSNPAEPKRNPEDFEIVEERVKFTRIRVLRMLET
jgi:hypothetical protein